MPNYKDFVLECLKWAYGRWGKGERLLTIVNSALTAIGMTGFALGLAQWGYLIYLVAIPIIFIFFIAPYRLWRQQKNDLTVLTTKKLDVKLEEQPEITEQHIWWHLVVRNPSSVPIDGCYGQLLSFTPNYKKRPYQAFNLPWSSFGGVYTKTANIPGRSHKYLDVAMTNRRDLYIVTLHPNPALRGTPFPEPPGVYEAEIQVGSEKEAFEPTRVKLKITLDDRGDLSIKEKD